MRDLHVSFHYARSEMERAILMAGQFAHVPESAVKETLSSLSNPYCQKVSIHFQTMGGKPGFTDVKEVGFLAEPTLRYFAAKFSTLCPVCLSPVGLEKRSRFSNPFPTWLRYEGDDAFPVEHIKDEPVWYDKESRLPRKCSRLMGMAHLRCGDFDFKITNLSNASMKEDTGFISHETINVEAYLKWVAKQDRVKLRFNPRLPHPKPPLFQDMRTVIDTPIPPGHY